MATASAQQAETFPLEVDEGLTPASLGFAMPAEWEPHTRTFMGFPDRLDNWRNNAEPAQRAYAAVAAAISLFEPVTVFCNPDKYHCARAIVPKHITVAPLDQNDAWFRDTGPLFVTRLVGEGAEQRREVAGVKFQFNSWGGKDYANWDKDQQVARAILHSRHVPKFEAKMTLEGGSIHVDGEGTLLTTEECLLNKNRNPNFTKEQIEQHLRDYLGVHKIIWLPRGLYLDEDTDGHVDNFACFARPGVVLLSWTDDTSDPQYERSQEALEVLEKETDARGRSLQVIKVPIPGPLFMSEEEAEGVKQVEGTMPRQAGQRLAGSYINYYTCNGGAVVPHYNVPQDKVALDIIQKAIPERRVVSVPTRDILLGGGNIHCITQQEAHGVSACTLLNVV